MNYETLWQRLTDIYETGEAKAIVRLVLEVRFGLTMTDILCDKIDKLTIEEQKDLKYIIQRLETGEPVQYVLGEADFGGRTFHVGPGVLIPRPETYELCKWSLPPTPSKWKGHILDIGTGSGCIACTLAAEIPNAEVTAWDISDDALRIAAENAKRANVHVSFEKVDVLNSQFSILNSQFDIIVSNPPYVCNKERAGMERNVLEHEPALALFVPDDDPLKFYRAIAGLGQRMLNEGGWLYFEINPLYVNELCELLRTMSYHDINIHEDQFGKQRFIRAQR